jgi:hypothetical protein
MRPGHPGEVTFGSATRSDLRPGQDVAILGDVPHEVHTGPDGAIVVDARSRHLARLGCAADDGLAGRPGAAGLAAGALRQRFGEGGP